MWILYILQCADKTLYTGITNDLKRRINEHNSSPKGARYTRARRPVSLAYADCFASRSDASKAEWAMKKLSREQKQQLIKKYNKDKA